MKRFVLILLVICPWLINAQPLHYATSYDSAFIQAKEEGKMVLVYAYSPCRLCDDITEKLLSLKQVQDGMRFGIARSEMKFPFVSALTFRYL